MIAACYSMDLYCENAAKGGPHVKGTCPHWWSEFPHVYTGETWGECARQARRDGWKIARNRQLAYCPDCSGKKKSR